MKIISLSSCYLFLSSWFAVGLVQAAESDSPTLTSPDQVYAQTFQHIGPIGNAGIPWTQGETIPGFYVYLGGLEESDDNVPEFLNQSRDGMSTGTLRFYCYTLDGQNSLGFATGSSTQGAYLALRLENKTGETIPSITLSYTGHQWFDGVNRTKKVPVSFALGDPASMDNVAVSDYLSQDQAGQWNDFAEATFLLPKGEDSGEVDPMTDGKVEVSADLKFLDWKPDTALWLRWDFGVPPQGFRLSIDDIKVIPIKK